MVESLALKSSKGLCRAMKISVPLIVNTQNTVVLASVMLLVVLATIIATGQLLSSQSMVVWNAMNPWRI
jgi:hypothetical protein